MVLRTRLVWGFAILLGAVGTPSRADRLGSSRQGASSSGWNTISAESVAAPTYDAYIDMIPSSYPDASSLTTGNAQPWYESTAITKFFNGSEPSSQQQWNFMHSVFQDVEQTFRLSGVSVALTANPYADANHTLSLVSNTSSEPFPGAIGTTYLGGNGFSFIDPEANSAQTLNQLEWIVAHNISHELMLAFGVGENYDQTGNYVDAKNANWAMMVNPNATFSSAAAQALNQALTSQNANGMSSPTNAQILEPLPSPIPEPGTLALWGFGVLALTIGARRRKRGQVPFSEPRDRREVFAPIVS